MMKLNAKKSLCITILLALMMCITGMLGACGCGKTDDSDKEYTITFETGGGSEIEPITVKSGETAEKPENPTKAGHIFKGWYLDLNDVSGGAFIFDETPIVADLTLYALWQIRQYTVSYQDKDGNAVFESIVADWGSLLDRPDDTALAKEGFLIKWYTASGDIWNFETSKVVANTVLTYRYVSTKDTYNAAEVAEIWYPSYDKVITDPSVCQGHYTENADSVYYTYAGTSLQQVILNVELATLNYSSVTIVARSVGFEVNDGVYTFDASSGGTFSQLRAYILTDLGGNVHYNDKGSSGYDPVNYYIQSTGTNRDLFSSAALEGGWTAFTFNLASLKFWNDGETLFSFCFGFVSTSKAIEIKSVVFNEVDKTQTFTVDFVGRLGNTLVESQTVGWNQQATKPAKLDDADGCVYTGEWLDSSDEVFDFNKGIRSNLTLYPQYTVVGKYSWTGEEVGRDFFAAYNEDKTLPAAEYAHNGNTVFTYNNGSGSALRQIASDNLNLTIGDYRYITIKWRTVNYNGYTYNSSGTFNLVRIYLLTDLGGDVLDKDLEGAENFYLHFAGLSATEITSPVDMSAKFADGWYVVTVDLNVIPYYRDGTTLKGIAIGTTTGNINAIEVSEIYFSTEIGTADEFTVSFVDENGNAITGIDDQTVIYGKAAVMPDSALVPEKPNYAFDCWVDEDGNAFNFGAAVISDVVLKPAYVVAFEGSDYVLTGQDIVDNFTASFERYGNTVSQQESLSLDLDGNAKYDFSGFNKPNMTITMLDAGICVHEGSKLVITYESDKFDTYTVNRLNLCIAFRGQNPETQIHNSNTNTYFQYTGIAYGTTSGTGANGCISFTVDETTGIVTVTFDLYAMQQAYKAKGISEEGVDLNYIDAFTFMVVETSSGTSAQTSKATLTYHSIEFKDVLIEDNG